MKTYQNSRIPLNSRIQVISHKSNSLSKINDNRAVSVMQAKMLSAIQCSGQERHVAQCRLKVGEMYYSTLENVKGLMASDPAVGWDDRWEGYVNELLEEEKGFSDIKQLESILERCVALEYRNMVIHAGGTWNPAWDEVLLNEVAKYPVYSCKSAKELVELLDRLTGGYFKPVSYKSGFSSGHKYADAKAYESSSKKKMEERERMLLMDMSMTPDGYVYHGTDLNAARAILACGFLSPANPSFRKALDASKDGFLSFSPVESGAAGVVIFRMKISEGDIMRWQFRVVREGAEVVTTLAVPTYRLEWRYRNEKKWKPVTE